MAKAKDTKITKKEAQRVYEDALDNGTPEQIRLTAKAIETLAQKGQLEDD